MAVWLGFILAFASCGCEPSSGIGTDVFDTIVVGMGASGTAAASELAKAGKRVLGLEAQRIVGGRVWTFPCGGNLEIFEMGAEWIHGSVENPSYILATENNISLKPDILDERVVLSNRKTEDMTLWDELMTATLDIINDPPKKPTSLGDHISKKLVKYLAKKHPNLKGDTAFISEYLSFVNSIVGTYEGADDFHDVTTHSAFGELGGSQVISWGRNGYDTLFDLLLNTNNSGLPTLTVKLNTEVTQITWPLDPVKKVQVMTKGGDNYVADNVIVTMSVGVLKERYKSLLFPQPPPEKIKAIEHIGIGIVNKIVLIFSDRWWPVNSSYFFVWTPEDLEKVPEEDKWMTKVAGTTQPSGCDKALVLWTYGAAARYIENLREEVIRAKSMELLKRFLGGNLTITEPTNMFRSRWYSNEFTRGSYSYDSLKTPEHPSLRSDLGEPLTDSAGKPRVLFAGEATNPTHFSTVHGAVNSGRREAARLLPGSNIIYTSTTKNKRYHSALGRS